MTAVTITVDLLQAAIGCPRDLAQKFAGPLREACEAFDITTPQRVAAFLAQVGHESAGLQYVREIASGAAYEGRVDLGNVQPGDGVRYRGRGLIQITGRDNYRGARDRLRQRFADVPDFEAAPELAEFPKWAAATAAEWWVAHGCNGLADRGEFVKLGRLINRGNADHPKPANGEEDRIGRWARARSAIDMAVVAEMPPEPAPVSAPAPAPEPSMPAGEAPGWNPPPPPQKEKTVGPFAAMALDAVVGAVPALIDMFKGDSKVAARNAEAAKVVVNVAKDALKASNEQDVIERLRDDPAAVAAVRKAVQERWFEITEAGGGGIDGARKFIAAAAAAPGGERVWRILEVVTYAALGFLVLANIIGSAAWGVSMWRSAGVESATQFLSQVITADIGAAMIALGFWLGSSYGSRQKDGAQQSGGAA